MSYLGNTPASRFTSMDKQTITGDGGTGYTLDYAVGSEQEIEVFVNNVRQEPSVAYTVAGTALTMTGNVASTDDFYVVFQGKAQQTATHPPTHDLTAAAGTFSGDVTTTGDFKPTGKEYFQVALTTAQDGISDGIATVVDFGGKGTVVYDTKSKFDSSNDAYEFDSADGVYLISFSVGIRSDVVSDEILVEVGGRVQFSTDNFSNTLDAQNQEFGNAARVMNNSSDSMGTMTVTGQYIYKNTSAGTKIRLQGTSNTTGGTYEFAIATDNMINITFGSAARCTYLTVVRIA